MRTRRPDLPLLTAALLLAGCASDALRESDRLMATGQREAALARLEAAARAEPRRADVYNAWVTQRGAMVTAYVRDADALRAQRQHDAAEAQYRHALRLDGNADAARSGLAAIERERRIDNQAGEAAAALRAGDAATAERRARAVLQAQPTHRGARAVMQAVAEQQARNAATSQQLKAALARTVTLELRDAPLKHVFEILGREGALNIILDKEVKPDARTTLVVRDSKLDEAIKLLLLTNQLERRVLNDNTLLVFPATANKLREYQELVMRTFYLANADAKQTAAMLRAMVKTRDIFTDEKLNLVMMRDTPDAVRLAEQLVAAQDLPEPEVMLEVEVLEVASSLVREIGTSFPSQLSVGPTAPSGDPATSPGLVQLSSTMALRGFVANPLLLLNLRQNDGASNLLANPRIRVKNRDKARVHIGERVPVITTTSTANVGVSSSVTYLETGLKLDVEPNVHLDDDVAIKVQLEVSNILEQLNVQGTVSYRLGTRNAATTLRLRDGETQVLAGLINNEDRRSIARVPLIGEVPVFGRLFRNDNDQTVKSEIVLLITPRIVRNIERPESVAASFPSGTDAAPGAAPLRLEGSVTLASALQPAFDGAAPALAQAAPLVVTGPAQVAVGDEFTLSLTLASAKAMGARVALSYDPTLIAPASGDPGQTTLDLRATGQPGAAQAAQVRFKVLATRPAETVITIHASSSEGAVSAPDSHAISIITKRP